MGKTHVDNRNKEHDRFCTAFDGEQVQVNRGAKRAPIDEKFTWKMHPDVTLSSGSVRTFKTADEEADEKKAQEEAQIHAELEQEEAEKRKNAEAAGSPQTNP